ncbi:hypothetical protein CERSUDRAFT_37258, partial [Gelatoporia subvermispora B]
LTVHKAQGRTFPKAFADIESCSGTDQPYVMLSRVKSLDGLVILRPFRRSKISCRFSQDTRKEIDRLHELGLRTTV